MDGEKDKQPETLEDVERRAVELLLQQGLFPKRIIRTDPESILYEDGEGAIWTAWLHEIQKPRQQRGVQVGVISTTLLHIEPGMSAEESMWFVDTYIPSE